MMYTMPKNLLSICVNFALATQLNHLVEVAVSMSDSQVQDMSWFDFLDDITEPELIQYLKERRLYVNEPVNTSEEE